jgi:hypothetical protein
MPRYTFHPSANRDLYDRKSQLRAEGDANARYRRAYRVWPANEGHGGAMTRVAVQSYPHTHRMATEPQSALS